MNRQAVFPSSRPRPSSPYSPGIRFGNLVFTSGQVGTDAAGQVPPDIREQTRNCLDNIQAVLETAGTNMAHVLKATVFLTDIQDFAAMNEVYRRAFPGDLPARSTVEVSALARPELKVEIEVVAALP
ncbi:MAG TPA: RidA family protein [bacterium]|nr:RidA family protein [bacterium]